MFNVMERRLAAQTPEQRASARALFDDHQEKAEHYARALAKKLGRKLRPDDAVNAGLIGLWEATTTWSESLAARKGNSFWTYASQRVRGAIYDHLRRQMPSWLRRKTDEERESLPYVCQLDSILSKAAANTAKSGMDKLGELTDPRDDCRQVDAADEVRGLLARLDETDREVLRLYYLEGLTMRQVGVRVGYSEANISHIVARLKAWGAELYRDQLAYHDRIRCFLVARRRRHYGRMFPPAA